MFADATALRATASEVTALVDRSNSMAVVSPYMHSQATIFDACLTYGVPVLSTAATGIYAFHPAAESQISVKVTPHTWMYIAHALDISLGVLPAHTFAG